MAWSAPLAKGLPGWTPSEVGVSCSAVDGSLCAGWGPSLGLHALLSESVKKLSQQSAVSLLHPSFMQGPSCKGCHGRPDMEPHTPLGVPLSMLCFLMNLVPSHPRAILHVHPSTLTPLRDG